MTHAHQTVERFEIMAYLRDNETLFTIDAILTNSILTDLDLKGKHRFDFDSLEDDVQAGLEWYISRETPVEVRGYFDQFRTNKAQAAEMADILWKAHTSGFIKN